LDGLKPGSRLAVGSLPQGEAAEALRFQARFFPEIPAWPQLPKRSRRESMVRQGLSGIPGMVWGEEGNPIWTLREADTEEALELLVSENRSGKLGRAAFLEGEADGFEAFRQAMGGTLGAGAMALKGQCAGPITLGLALRDESGKPALASKARMEILVEYLLLQARWQCARLLELGKPVVFFLDEPAMNDRLDPQTYALQASDWERWYESILGRLQEEGFLTGIHACGAGSWNWAFKTPMEIFHWDAFRDGAAMADQADAGAAFLAKGGILAWGLVPTQPFRGSFPEPAELLTRWIEGARLLARRGPSPEEIAGRSFFSTSCGLGISPIGLAEQAVRCLDMLATLWRVETEEGTRPHLF